MIPENIGIAVRTPDALRVNIELSDKTALTLVGVTILAAFTIKTVWGK